MSTTALDGEAWLRRWDAQQQLHIPHREDRFAAITDTLAAFAGEGPRVIDLGSGPGSLSGRVLRRLPGAEIVALDADPVLLEIGRSAFADQSRVRFVDADLRGEWGYALPVPGPFDAAVSTTALHWLELPDILHLYAQLAVLLRVGGVFVNGDRFEYDHDQPTIAAAANALRTPEPEPVPGGAETWETWWTAAAADPALAEAMAERTRRRHEHPHDHARHALEFHRAALLSAGFAEVGTVWQRLTDRVLVAIR